jgi:circadian clock protein KaiB
MKSAARNEQRQDIAARNGKYVLWLFVAGDRPNSLEAQKNIAQICEVHLLDRYELIVFDVFQDFQTARDNGILVTPTLLRIAPPPRVTILGNLSDTQKVLTALALAPGTS